MKTSVAIRRPTPPFTSKRGRLRTRQNPTQLAGSAPKSPRESPTSVRPAISLPFPPHSGRAPPLEPPSKEGTGLEWVGNDLRGAVLKPLSRSLATRRERFSAVLAERPRKARGYYWTYSRVPNLRREPDPTKERPEDQRFPFPFRPGNRRPKPRSHAPEGGATEIPKKRINASAAAGARMPRSVNSGFRDGPESELRN